MAKIITENFRVETSTELFNSFKNINPTLSTNFLTLLQAYNTTNSLNLSTANNLAIQDFVDEQLQTLRPESHYYIMASSVDKDNEVNNTQKEKRDFLRRVIFANKVTDTNVRYMFYKNDWVADTVYDDFDDMEDITTSNSVVTVKDIEGNYTVYKCLANNNGGKSTVQPSNTGINPSSYETVITADNYQWKYMFTVSASDVEIYQTSDSLPLPYPSYGDASVIAAAKESVSQIIIEQTPVAQFTAYRFGPSTSAGNTSDVVVISSTQTGSIKTLVLAITPRTDFALYNTDNAYKNMYLKTNDGNGRPSAVYDITSSSYLDNDKFKITINTTDSIANASICQVVPKVNVSRSTATGEPCKAYGVIDQFGTLTKVEFMTKGTEYKFATAEIVYPNSLTTPGVTTLRCVVSPKGGHGSNPIAELSMSRLAVITNFSGESDTVPDSNGYTKVGLVKNPTFTDGSRPIRFDNRTTIVIAGDQTGKTPGIAPNGADVKYFIRQYVNALTGQIRAAPVVGQELGPDDEVVSATIHQSSYDEIQDETTFYLVDYYGNFKSTFKAGRVYISSGTQITASELTINNDADVVYGKYEPYTGELLHYVDFAKITRLLGRKEKIKFIFDF